MLHSQRFYMNRIALHGFAPAFFVFVLMGMLVFPHMVIAQESTATEDSQEEVGGNSNLPGIKQGGYGIDETVGFVEDFKQEVPHKDKDVPSLIAFFIKAVLSLVATIFFALMVYAGIRWMTAMGEPTRVEHAKKVMTAGLIGAVVVSASYAIVQFIITSFG